MKNSADLGGCYPPRPITVALLDLQNFSYPTQPYSIIVNIKKNCIIHKKALNSSKANNDFYLESNIFPRSMLFQGDLPLNTP